jgi:hypothetical protein
VPECLARDIFGDFEKVWCVVWKSRICEIAQELRHLGNMRISHAVVRETSQ